MTAAPVRTEAQLLLFSESEDEVIWRPGALCEANDLLRRSHYLGPSTAARYVFVGVLGKQFVAAQVWRWPTARMLPADGSWLELARWCLTPGAGVNAGSRMHAYAVRWLRKRAPHLTTLVSYSDPSQGHTGALYKACNWQWAPTWMRLRIPPSRGGRWSPGAPLQEVKDRWVFALRSDHLRAEVLRINDAAICRRIASGDLVPSRLQGRAL